MQIGKGNYSFLSLSLSFFSFVNDHTFTHSGRNNSVRRRRENLQLLPGDRLTMTCTYNSVGYTSPIYNGEGYEDEMCLLPIAIRPRLEQMTACGSFQDERGAGQMSLCDAPPFVGESGHDLAYTPLPPPPNNCPARE